MSEAATNTTSGYLHSSYIESLSAFGKPYPLIKSGGWILKRRIPDCDGFDAIGPYPLFVCRDWSQLGADLQKMKDEFVSLAVVTDPFGKYNTDLLKESFPDVVMPYKEHFVIDLSQSVTHFVSSHHRYYARKSLRHLSVQKCHEPALFINVWMRLYNVLISRHSITGIRAFSHASFERQLKVPGLVAFRAEMNGETNAMALWFTNGSVAYYHLVACSNVGYQHSASYALLWSAIEYFATQGYGWLDLGANAGLSYSDADDLAHFKRGWATDTRTAFLCGRIFHREMYKELTRLKGARASRYFPAYRQAVESY